LLGVLLPRPGSIYVWKASAGESFAREELTVLRLTRQARRRVGKQAWWICGGRN